MTEKKLSKAEAIKDKSQYLKGNILQELADSKPYVSDESYELLKFHGSYQGYDRDTATKRKKAGLDKEWEFMLRMKCPGGRLNAKQYVALDGIAEKYANGTLRITTRETFQFHCIVKENLKAHIAEINKLLLSTLGGCGDVVRNIMCPPAPYKNAVYEKMLADTYLLAEHCAPKTARYHEIWLDGENVATDDSPENEVEPLYGKHYLPRKFKISVSIPEDNSIDALTHDLAFILIYEGDEFKGYNVCLGGGLGMTHNKADTYPRLATPIAFVEPEDLLKAAEAVIKLQRDHGDRSNRKHARLKYVVEEKGLDWTRKTLEEYFGSTMQDAKPMAEFELPDHMGWHEQGDGKWFLGLPISSGRIIDRGEEQIRTGLREVISEYGMDVILTSDQNIILCDIAEDKKNEISDKLRKFGIQLKEDISLVSRDMFACVSLPTCGKALAEAERIQIPFTVEIENVMKKHGILSERLGVRIAGCPNGCSRPYSTEIGIVGRMPGHYSLFVGGDFEGTRLAFKILDRVPYDNMAEVLDVLIGKYVSCRNEGQMFGNYMNDLGKENVIKLVNEQLGDKYKWAV